MMHPAAHRSTPAPYLVRGRVRVRVGVRVRVRVRVRVGVRVRASPPPTGRLRRRTSAHPAVAPVPGTC